MTVEALNPYRLFANALSYPKNGEKSVLLKNLADLTVLLPDQTGPLADFIDYLKQHTEEQCQELYTHTFEIQALCQLDLGYVLFGEDYKRGQFLVHLKLEHLKVHNDCGSELPDHLVNVLNLLPMLQDKQLGEELIHTFILPALEKMLPAFKEKGNVYGGVLQSLRLFLIDHYPAPVANHHVHGVSS